MLDVKLEHSAPDIQYECQSKIFRVIVHSVHGDSLLNAHCWSLGFKCWMDCRLLVTYDVAKEIDR